MPTQKAFDGTGDYVRVIDPTGIDPSSSWFFGMWVRASSAWEMVVKAGDNDPATPARGFTVLKNSGGWFFTVPEGSQTFQMSAGSSVDTWYRLGGVWDGSGWPSFVQDGVANSPSGFTSNPLALVSGDSLVVGEDVPGITLSDLNGGMAFLFWVNTASGNLPTTAQLDAYILDPQSVITDFGAAGATDAGACKLMWAMCGAGDETDRSGTGNTGTVEGTDGVLNESPASFPTWDPCSSSPTAFAVSDTAGLAESTDVISPITDHYGLSDDSPLTVEIDDGPEAVLTESTVLVIVVVDPNAPEVADTGTLAEAASLSVTFLELTDRDVGALTEWIAQIDSTDPDEATLSSELVLTTTDDQDETGTLAEEVNSVPAVIVASEAWALNEVADLDELVGGVDEEFSREDLYTCTETALVTALTVADDDTATLAEAVGRSFELSDTLALAESTHFDPGPPLTGDFDLDDQFTLAETASVTGIGAPIDVSDSGTLAEAVGITVAFVGVLDTLVVVDVAGLNILQIVSDEFTMSSETVWTDAPFGGSVRGTAALIGNMAGIATIGA